MKEPTGEPKQENTGIGHLPSDKDKLGEINVGNKVKFKTGARVFGEEAILEGVVESVNKNENGDTRLKVKYKIFGRDFDGDLGMDEILSVSSAEIPTEDKKLQIEDIVVGSTVEVEHQGWDPFLPMQQGIVDSIVEDKDGKPVVRVKYKILGNPYGKEDILECDIDKIIRVVNNEEQLKEAIKEPKVEETPLTSEQKAEKDVAENERQKLIQTKKRFNNQLQYFRSQYPKIYNNLFVPYLTAIASGNPIEKPTSEDVDKVMEEVKKNPRYSGDERGGNKELIRMLDYVDGLLRNEGWKQDEIPEKIKMLADGIIKF